MVLILIHGVKDQKVAYKIFYIEQLMKILKPLLVFLFEGKVIQTYYQGLDFITLKIIEVCAII